MIPPSNYGPTPPLGEVILAPTIIATAAQIAAPPASMIAATSVTYQLNVAPYTRYQSDGTRLVSIANAPTNLDTFAKVAAIARLNNPRVNPVMSAPPVVTNGTSADGTLTLNFPWNGPFSGVFNPYSGTGPFNFYGGAVRLDGFGSSASPSVYYGAVAGSALNTQLVTRVETVADANKVQFGVFAFTGTSKYRVIVNGQYVTFASTTLNFNGAGFISVDFTSVGGRASRDVILELYNCNFGQNASVLPTEGLYKPSGTVKRAYMQGDSFTAYGGTSIPFNGFVNLLADYLGIRDMWNGGIAGTGYTNNASGIQTTAVQRVTDIIASAPDLIFSFNGHNDAGFSAPAITQAAVKAWLTGIRASPVTAGTPIIMAGLWGNEASGSSTPTESAIAAAVTAFNDPLVFNILTEADPNGAWMTGTGSTAAPTGTGNCDVYIGADAVHPNDLGHAFLAGRLADSIMRQVFTP